MLEIIFGGKTLKFSVGYQLSQGTELIHKIIELKENIDEVYFSWADFPNGRNNQIKHANMIPWEAQKKQMEDLKRLSDADIELNLLFNAKSSIKCFNSLKRSNGVDFSPFLDSNALTLSTI